MRILTLILIVASLGLLVPGVTRPMFTITGTIDNTKLADAATGLIVDSMVERDLAKGTDKTEEELRTKAENSVKQMLGMLGLKIPEGEIEAYRKTRSILGTVKELFDTGHRVVGFLVMLFSVVIPTIKILLMLAGTFGPSDQARRTSLAVSRAISKWSMADVFVVAIGVAFMALNASKDLDEVVRLGAEFEVGFFLFLGYCLFSIATSTLVNAPEAGGEGGSTTGDTPA